MKRTLQLFFLSGCAALIFLLASHHSLEPAIWGRYTLPYFIFMLSASVVIGAVSILFLRSPRKALLLSFSNGMVLGICLLLVELGGQIYASARPSYQALVQEPDAVIGWKLAPGLTWKATGDHWYARDFMVENKSNSWGFRDLERQPAKPSGVIRIALLGDSFVEAAQVPFEKTAGFLLEQALNRKGKGPASDRLRYEVLNFGLSSHGIGQNLLTWRAYVSRFQPDYVFVFVSTRTAERTLAPYEEGAFPSTRGKKLWIRPTFRIENGKPIKERAGNFRQFSQIHRQLIRDYFGTARIRKRDRKIFLKDCFHGLKNLAKTLYWDPLMKVQRDFLKTEKPAGPFLLEDGTVRVNLAVLDQMHKAISSAGARLVVVDVLTYFHPANEPFSTVLEKFCNDRRIGYLSLSKILEEAQTKGVKISWKHDGHFNETGNELFAHAMQEWLTARNRS